MLTDEQQLKFAHRVMIMRMSTLRTLLDYREIIEPDALRIIESEVKARSREVFKKRQENAQITT